MESIDTFLITATSTTSVTLSVAAIGLTVLPISTGIVFGKKNTQKRLIELNMEKHGKHNKEYERARQIIFSLISFREKFCKKLLMIKLNEIDL